MHNQHQAFPGHDPDHPQETTFMSARRHADRARLAVLAAVLAAVAGVPVGAQEGYGPAGAGDCQSCRSSAQRPPWHGSAMAGRGYPVGGGMGAPCMSGHCGPSPVCRSCGPKACGPCGAPGVCGLTGACHAPVGAGWWGMGCHAPLPPCLPRLHSCLRDGILLSPQPLVVPRCHQCGAHIPGGF